MPKLRKVHHEQFCQFIAGGMSHAAAYRKVSGNDHSSDCKADQWMKCRGVEERIQELRRENDRKAEFDREAAIRWLERVITTPAGEVDEHSPLCQAVKTSGGVREIRVPDKISAIQELSRLCGWHEPERLELGVANSLTRYLAELRNERTLPAGPIIEFENGGNGEEHHG